jgi:hypothetical protein
MDTVNMELIQMLPNHITKIININKIIIIITITIHMDKLNKSIIKQIQDHAQLMLNVCMETVTFIN